MARGYKLDPDYVISRRLDTADGKPGAVIDGADSASRVLALLTIVPGGHERPAASRAVARYLTWTGCQGWKCGYGEHAGHLELRDELLNALGLAITEVAAGGGR
jgi:hypothetical protein